MFSITKTCKILVIGDVMLDHYIYGDCNRISPEAPVPVVEVRSEDYLLGGAGNVVKNLNALGCQVNIVCIVGDDEHAVTVVEKLKNEGVPAAGIVTDGDKCTTIKTRILAARHQLIRLDREDTRTISTKIEKQIADTVKLIAKNYDVVLVSDYNKGMLSAGLLQTIFESCRKESIPTILDPKGTDFAKYKGVNIIKPNKKEAVAATGIKITDTESLYKACAKIKEITACDDVIVTMSEEGIALYADEKIDIVPTRALEVIDVTGAGDTVLASLGLAIAAGGSLHQACIFANHAASIVVNKTGSATATLAEIEESFRDS
ncbi:D-glycero-beta-D-manno-heptose-7-phosphate kinase [Mucilaginibacter sp. AW1-3]